MNPFEKLKEFLDSEEGKEHVKQFHEKRKRKEIILESQFERFRQKFAHNFDEIVEKVMNKYNSDHYVERCYKQGHMPSEALYFFFFKYAKAHGRECTADEWEKHGNMFTSEIYTIHGHYFNLMHGQGSVIQITKD